ncbi:MAG: MerR family transcriptional regulator [Hyphomicrobiaceae bacterium]
MNSTAHFLNPSDTARLLGVSTKALRVYEERGLLHPLRTSSGWRSYGPDEIARGRDIVELRGLGLSLNEIGRALEGDAAVLARALAAHEATLEARMGDLRAAVSKVRNLRRELAGTALPAGSVMAQIRRVSQDISVAVDLPWPWGGERFEMRGLQKLTHVVGPLGSGKTRLAMCLATAIPGAKFIGLERQDDGAAGAKALLDADESLRSRVREAINALEADGGVGSDALLALLTAIEEDGPTVHVIDMLEHGLDAATQEALMCHLRRRAAHAKPLIFLTRSSAVLDLDTVCPGEAIIFCPANHGPPFLVAPYRGAAGFESLAMCLASPEVRARTEGVIAVRRSA